MEREEAIEKVRQMSLPKETMEILEALAPELRESEDERIREKIKKCIIYDCSLTQEETDDMLAYLEKQKEPKLLNNEKYQTVPIEILDRLYASEKELQEIKQKEQNPDYAYQQLIKTVEEEADALYPNLYKEGTKEWSNREIEREYFMKGRMHSAIKANPELYHNWPEVKDALTQKQKEQKPSEWRPTKEQFNYLVKAIMTLGEKGDCRTAGVLSEIRNGLKCSFPDWKMSLDYPKEGCNVSLNGEIKKIQEWSEEDKAWLSEVYFAIDHSMYSDDERKAMKKYIDFLRHQSRQEWSEEDEKMLVSFLHKVEVCDLLTNKEYAWIVKRLKSLRPSWKPSEEQMEALNALNCHGGLSYVGQQNQLISLYNDLKKLM